MDWYVTQSLVLNTDSQPASPFIGTKTDSLQLNGKYESYSVIWHWAESQGWETPGHDIRSPAVMKDLQRLRWHVPAMNCRESWARKSLWFSFSQSLLLKKTSHFFGMFLIALQLFIYFYSVLNTVISDRDLDEKQRNAFIFRVNLFRYSAKSCPFQQQEKLTYEYLAHLKL